MKPQRQMKHKSGGLNWRARLFLAQSDLRHRRVTVTLNIVAGALAAVYILTPGFYAVKMYVEQRRMIDEARPREIKVGVSDPNRRDQRFTDARLVKLQTMPGVAMAFPAIEVWCSASLDGARAFDLPAEGCVPGDPTLGPQRLAWGRPVATGAREVVLSRPLFERMGGTYDLGRPLPQKLTLEVRRTHAGKPQVSRQELEIVGLLHAQTPDKLFVPLELADALNLWCGSKIDNDPATGTHEGSNKGYDACWAYVPAVCEPRVAAEAASLQVKAERVGTVEIIDAPGPIWASVSAADGAANPSPDIAQLIRQKLRLAAYPATFIKTRGETIVTLCESDPRRRDQVPPPAKATAGADVRWDVCIRNPLDFQAAELTAAGNGLTLVPLGPPPRRSVLIRYRLSDIKTAAAGDDLVEMVAMTKPTFAVARPAMELDATAGDSAAPIKLAASDPADPARFAAGFQRGDWIADEQDVVIPADARLGGSFDSDKAAAIGRQLDVIFTRDGAAGAESLSVHLTVRGIASGTCAYFNRKLAEQVRAWQTGSLEYDVHSGRFESRAEMARRWGAVRATVFATDDESVETVVRGLQRLGYHTEDQLASIQSLRRMGKGLLSAVTLMVLGSLLAGSLCVLVTSLLNLRQKRYEVGILRASGASRRDVLAIFLIQALALGVASFMLGSIFTLFEPFARPALCQLIAIRPEMLHGSPLLIWWLPASALAVCVGMSLIAGVVPAWRICRLAPVDLLRERDSG